MMRVRADEVDKRHYLTNAQCDEDCGEEWDTMEISPSEWAAAHTATTKHVTSVGHSSTWREVILEVIHED